MEDAENAMLKRKISDLERLNFDFKLEILRFYMPKIVYVM